MAKKNRNPSTKRFQIKITKKIATLLIVIGCVAAVHLTKFVIHLRAGSLTVQSALVRSKGNPQAGFKVIEYIDLQCPACARGAKVLRETLSRYPEGMHLELKYFPLDHMHTHAIVSALYAECAGRQNKFWEFVEPLLERQAQWGPLTNAEPVFREIAEKAGIEKAQLSSCLDNPSTESIVLKEKSQGKTLGVQSTPTYFINGKMFVGVKSLQQEIDQHFGVSESGGQNDD